MHLFLKNIILDLVFLLAKAALYKFVDDIETKDIRSTLDVIPLESRIPPSGVSTRPFEWDCKKFILAIKIFSGEIL